MWFETLQTTFLATFQILLMAGVGYVLVKRRLLDDGGLDLLSGLLVKIFLPQLIFFQLTQHFDFGRFSYWWIFPLLSFSTILFGVLVSRGLLLVNKGCEFKNHFSALVAFQNCGYIPLILVANLFQGEAQDTLSIYIFLFMMGFDLATWSLGVWLLTSHQERHIQWRRILNPPFLTTLGTLVLISFGGQHLVPQTILRPVKMFGGCALPMAMIVVGGNLAHTRLHEGRRLDLGLLILAKLVIMPACALAVVKILRPDYLIGFIIVLEAAVPSAVNLSVVARHFKVDSRLINQGIFWDSLASVLTVPVFLAVYNFIARGM